VRFKNTAKLLHNSQNFQELNLKEYRCLLKSFLGNDVKPETVFLNTDQILQNICSLSQEKINNISFVDYILLLLNIRAVSIGNIINLFTEDENNNQLKINLYIENIINTIFDNISFDIQTTINFNNIKVSCQIPSIKDILFFEKNNNFILNSLFINKIYFNNTLVKFHDYSYTDKEQIVKCLPIKLILLLDQFVNNFLQKINQINLLDSIKSKNFNKELPFLLNSQVLAFFIKLVFNTDLMNIYNNIFILSKAVNFNSDFLDNCTPGEFFIFVKKIEEINFQTKIKNSNKQSLDPINPPNDFIME
jgi:hypothetical protein